MLILDYVERPIEINRRNSNHKYWSHLVLITLQIVNTFTTIISIINSILSFNGPATIGSFFTKPSIGVIIVSCTIEGIPTWYNRFVLSMFEVVVITFANSLINCLKIISPVKCNFNSASVTLINHTLEKNANNALKFYKNLLQIVFEFNSIFKWLLFMYKSVILMLLCLRGYWCFNTIRALSSATTSSSSSYVLIGTSKIVFAWIKHIAFTLPDIIKIYLILTSMGNVNAESEKFVQKWITKIWNIQDYDNNKNCNKKDQYWKCSLRNTRFESLRKKINEVCIPIRFQSGSFYFIRSWTILTFFSIWTTYIIVLLQI